MVARNKLCGPKFIINASRGKCIFERAIYSGEDNHFQEEGVIFKHALPPTFYHSKLLWLCIQ